MSTRRVFLHNGLLSIPPLAALASACGEKSSANLTPTSAHGQVVRKANALPSKTVRVLYPRGSLGNVKPVAALFQDLTHHRVMLVEAELDEISSQMILDRELGRSGYDVALPATFGVPDLVEAGCLTKLDTFAEQHEPASLHQGMLYEHGDRYQGSLYGYQTDGDAYVMFYNRDWLSAGTEKARYEERFGTSLALPKTWQELDQQMAFFHAPDEGRFGGSLFRTQNYVAWEYWLRLHGQGCFPVSDNVESRFASDAGLAALEGLVEATKALEPGVFENSLFENFASYAKGDKYANMGWGGTQKHLVEAETPQFPVAYGMTPGGEKDGHTFSLPYFNWGWNFVVSSGAQQPELAYLFALFAVTPDVSCRSVREASGYFDPFRDEHYRDPDIARLYGADFLSVHRDSLRNCMPDFYLPGRGRYFAALQHGLLMVLKGQLLPELAMKQVDDKWHALTEQLGAEKQQQQWRRLKRSYPAELRGLLT